LAPSVYWLSESLAKSDAFRFTKPLRKLMVRVKLPHVVGFDDGGRIRSDPMNVPPCELALIFLRPPRTPTPSRRWALPGVAPALDDGARAGVDELTA
jgi:hypothetical protein